MKIINRGIGVVLFVGALYILPWNPDGNPIMAGIGLVLGAGLARWGTFDILSWW